MPEPKFDVEALVADLSSLKRSSNLYAAVNNVDKIIELLTAARDQVAANPDSPTAVLTMTKLQNPIKEGFEAINSNLKEVSKGQKGLGKALDKSFPNKPLPTGYDALSKHADLINRSITIHMLREGQFSVASTFIAEAQEQHRPPVPSPYHPSTAQNTPSDDIDETMEDGGADDANMNDLMGESHDLSAFEPQQLQHRFAEMYRVLHELKARNLLPAIQWARANSAELEARGSNLEFELCKLQYVWLFKGTPINGLPNNQSNSQASALAYARENFPRFQDRHLSEIQQLVSAMVFARNIGDSPYHNLFQTDSAFTEVASSFTREFCSLLGLSAESPLYIAATAGALALPQLLKYVQATRARGTEWTTTSELPFETPLPESMVFHSIFVCPVSKEQTTEENPPMMIPCGHVLAKDTLQRLCKGSRFKCPYCPSEGQIKDAQQIIL
ncbi:hypothetical protein GQ53DRAFT_427384 [Thozetella sp. PMI_491]|nr:hypothetical protein GQ53DRAFT_427384 [Thozetella sp. PMI_491]